MPLAALATAIALAGTARADAAVLSAAAQPQCTTGATGAISPTPPPSDPFYTPPDPLPTGRPGTIIRSEPVCIGDLSIPMPYAAWLIMYLSTSAENSNGAPSDFHATPIADTALIVEPLTRSLKPRPLVAYQNAEDSDSTLEAPSYTLRSGTSGDNATWQPMLAQGWELVVPDYEGPNSAYSAGPLEGHAVLDAIRAAENFSPTDGLEGRRTEVGTWGYSGGAIAAGWASELAARYAPRVRIAATIEGGVPADLKATFDAINNGFLAPGLAFAASVGNNAAYPNLLPESLLNAAGQKLAAQMRATGSSSYPQTYPPQNISDYTVCGCNPVDQPAQFPGVAEVIRANSLGGHIPTAPLYVYHDFDDELIPIAGVEQLVQTYCSGGATVDFRVYYGDEHVSNAVVGAPEAMAYLSSRIDGAPPVNTCGLPDNGGVVPPPPVPAEPLPPNPPVYPSP